MSEELKPCPFCGGAAESRLYDAQYFVQCVQCFNSTAADHDFEASAVAAWNTRAQAQAAPEAEPVAAVAYLDIGAGGYVDLGTDQPIEALEKMPYGRHMLGIIGTYGADGWKPSPSQQASKSEPVAYAAFSDNGNIRVWSRSLDVIEMMAAQGCKAVPLYTAQQHDAELVELLRSTYVLCTMRDMPTEHALSDLADRIDAKLATLSAKNEGGKA